ncbi:MAG: hypothetical protein LBG79_02680 [Spirochaetaceae bacterium]|jgi:D-methionine transport system substrate-binding protein|nr:hypothetical protein [Spirochaetaceae bacterium]
MKLKSVKILAVVLVFLVSGCSKSQQKSVTVKEINVACGETVQALLKEAIPYMEAKGYKMKYTLFDNNRNTLAALNDGSVDAVFAVHKPFMQSFNEAAGADLIMQEPYVYTVGMGLFSDKYDSIAAIPEGATITIANDAMNMDRGLRILEFAGLIVLNPDVERATVIDIKENPKKLKFVDMDQTQLVRTLESADGTVAFFSHMKNAGRDFNAYLARDEDATQYPIGLVIKPASKDEAWVADIIAVLRSEPVKAFANEYYGGLYEYY